jgi:hypothetical protein
MLVAIALDADDAEVRRWMLVEVIDDTVGARQDNLLWW